MSALKQQQHPLPVSSTAALPSHRRGRCSYRHHRAAVRAALVTCFALLFAVPAWLSLVFSAAAASSPPSSSSDALPVFSLQRLLFPWLRTAPSPTPRSSPDRPGRGSPRTAKPYFAEPPLPLNAPRNTPPLSLRHVVFGVASSATLWPRRREYLRLWWRARDMRGHVWIEDAAAAAGGAAVQDDDDLSNSSSSHTTPPSSFPPLRVSEDISRFRYTNPTGHPSGLRIARVVAEAFRLGLRDVRWFVLCDDDTILNPDNLVAVLAKHDWREMVYIGGPSESHSANTYFSHSMAFGGGGIAISYPLARALAEMQDDCLERYPKLYGSDDRLHACISELGVPLTRELGFHQWDIRGNAHGLLAAHPIAPFVSIHHVEAVDPIYPGLTSLDSLKLFTKAMRTEPRSFLQRSICYDQTRKLTFSVSVGYVVQVFPDIVLPRDLERAEKTYLAWNWQNGRDEFDFDTRDKSKSMCKEPILFFLKDVHRKGNMTTGSYIRAKVRGEFKRKVFCFPRSLPLPEVKEIQVLGTPLSKNWHLVPRRLCCSVNGTRGSVLGLVVGQCNRMTLGSVADSLWMHAT